MSLFSHVFGAAVLQNACNTQQKASAFQQYQNQHQLDAIRYQNAYHTPIPSVGELQRQEIKLKSDLALLKAEIDRRNGSVPLPAPSRAELSQSPALETAYNEMVLIWRLNGGS